jgi:crotonobetainyl-CoA:carnitine CoA-transferase CaiB-like acyl-CoA transferase
MNFLATGNNPRRYGNAHPNIVPYQSFQCSDGFIILAVGNDAQFTRFCALAGKPELAADERYQTNSGRVRNRDSLLPMVSEIMLSKSTADWLELLNQRGIPCGPINNLDQVFADPQVRHRGLQLELAHPTAGRAASVANPIKLSKTAIEYKLAPPLLGQHTDEVLGRLLNLDDDALATLRAAAIIA